jgi:uncharacterized Ntn-hydrolase superfamily protein
MAMRRHILNDTQDRLTEISGMAVEVLVDVMLDPMTAGDVRRKAAVDALTHAAPETAPKGQTEQLIDLRVDTSGPSMRDIRNRPRRLPERVVGVGELESITVEAEDDEEDGPPPPPPGGLKVPAQGLYDEPPVLSGNGHDEDDE